MSVNAIENLGNQNLTPKTEKQEGLRQAAKQFEAILLMQLTSALNKSGDDEGLLFGKDGGSDLAKKMFSEHLATAMADAGGIGLADTIMEQFGANSSKAAQSKKPFSNAIAAIQEISSRYFADK